MNDACLIQIVDDATREEHAITGDHNAALCERHGIDYRVCEGRPFAERPGRWYAHSFQRHVEIAMALQAGYQTIVYLDLDCVALKDVDLREALPRGLPDQAGALLGGVTYHHNAQGPCEPHLQAGALWLRAESDADRCTLLDLVMTTWGCDPVWHGVPITSNWDDNMALIRAIEILDLGERVAELDRRWNCPAWERDDETVIASWHGFREGRLEQMREAVAALSGAG